MPERFQKLSPIERIVLNQRLGLNGREKKNLGEIADFFGVSCDNIRQIQSAAIKKFLHSGDDDSNGALVPRIPLNPEGEGSIKLLPPVNKDDSPGK